MPRVSNAYLTYTFCTNLIKFTHEKKNIFIWTEFVHWAQQHWIWQWLLWVQPMSILNLASMHGILLLVIWLFAKLVVYVLIQAVAHWIWCRDVFWPQVHKKLQMISSKWLVNIIPNHVIKCSSQISIKKKPTKKKLLMIVQTFTKNKSRKNYICVVIWNL